MHGAVLHANTNFMHSVQHPHLQSLNLVMQHKSALSLDHSVLSDE